MSDPITPDGQPMVPGDVLLYRSTTAIGRAIRLLDGSEVSHAGLYLGDELVGEALLARGLVRQSFSKSIDGCRWVGVWRLKTPPASTLPVLNKAKIYLDQGNRYATEQILLLAVICSTRELDLNNPWIRRLAHAVITKATELVRKMQDERKQPMICSEFVYRCYDEAETTEPDPYRIEIRPVAAATAGTRFLGWKRRKQAAAAQTSLHPESLLGRLREEAGSLTAAFQTLKASATARPPFADEAELAALVDACDPDPPEPRRMASPLPAGPEPSIDDLRDAIGQLAFTLHEASDGGVKLGMGVFGPAVTRRGASPGETLEEVIADFVTPGDLFRSPSLTEIGRFCL